MNLVGDQVRVKVQGAVKLRDGQLGINRKGLSLRNRVENKFVYNPNLKNIYLSSFVWISGLFVSNSTQH